LYSGLKSKLIDILSYQFKITKGQLTALAGLLAVAQLMGSLVLLTQIDK